MRNWKMTGIAALVVLAAAATAAAPASVGTSGATNPATSQRTPNVSYTAAHVDVTHVAQTNCIEHGQTCTLNGTACCDSTDECKGTFPNTTCQAK
jgi:hypothetical protein